MAVVYTYNFYLRKWSKLGTRRLAPILAEQREVRMRALTLEEVRRRRISLEEAERSRVAPAEEDQYTFQMERVSSHFTTVRFQQLEA